MMHNIITKGQLCLFELFQKAGRCALILLHQGVPMLCIIYNTIYTPFKLMGLNGVFLCLFSIKKCLHFDFKISVIPEERL